MIKLDEAGRAAARKAYAKRWMPSDSAAFSNEAAAQVDYIIQAYLEGLPDKGEVGVKALEWNKVETTWWSAASVVGEYLVNRVFWQIGDNDFTLHLKISGVSERLDGGFTTLAKAQAAAQADYEARIRSALYLKPEVGAEPMGPDRWSVDTKTGYHVGLWDNETEAERAAAEDTENWLVTPLYLKPLPPARGSELPAGPFIAGDGSRTHWRVWKDGECRWTTNRNEATRFARREDAEAVHYDDDDVWAIVEYQPSPLASPPLSQPRAEVIEQVAQETRDLSFNALTMDEHRDIVRKSFDAGWDAGKKYVQLRPHEFDLTAVAALSSTSGATEPSDDYKEAMRHVEGGE